MSKLLIDILEIYNEIDFTCECIRLYTQTINDAKKAREQYSDNELDDLSKLSEESKKQLEEKYQGLKEMLSKLLEQVKKDPKFMQELENSTIVPERLKTSMVYLKAELNSSKANEKGQE